MDGQLTIINTQSSDAGLYVCEVENDVGYKTVAVVLYVRGKDHFCFGCAYHFDDSTYYLNS